MSQLILACAKTGRAFKSGFRVHRDDLRLVPLKWTAQFLCRICRHVHEFEFAQARLCNCPDRCPYNGACHLCGLAQSSFVNDAKETRSAQIAPHDGRTAGASQVPGADRDFPRDPSAYATATRLHLHYCGAVGRS